MTDVVANFTLEEEPSLTADFELGNEESLSAEFVLPNALYHDRLAHRDYPDQHPISAITDLQGSLDTLSGSIDDEITRATLAEGGLQESINTINSTLSGKQDTLIAGANIQIEDNVISATDTRYVAGEGISIQNNVISNTQTSAEWGNIQGALTNQTDLWNTLSGLGSQIDANHNEIGVIGQTIGGYGNIVTHDVNEFATAAQGAKADTAVQPAAISNMVTTNTGQTISGAKTFSNTVTMAGQTPIAASHNYNSYAVFQRLPYTREQIFSNGGDKLRLRGSETRPQYNGNDLALYSDIEAAALSAGTGIDITSGVVSVTAPTVINNATGTNSVALGDSSQSTAEGSVALGKSSRANSTYSTAIGYSAYATNTNSVAIGKQSKATAARTVAIGSGAEANANDAYVIKGINNTANTFQVGTYTLLNTSTGLIPDARISSTFATTSYVDDSVSTNTAYFDGSWATYADIPSTVAGFTDENLPEPTNNNYLVVLEDETQDGGTWRYKYVDDGLGYNKAKWSVEYEVNETPFTQAQLDAINSGVTTADVSLAQSALQSGDNISELVNNSGYITGITGSDVTSALGYTPYNSTNPNGYITGITSSDVTTALGYTPYNSTNPSGYITSSALSGYATETWVGNQGYITGITSGDVTTALGYTPYNSSNPNGYTSNVGTVTSVNNTSPDGNGNVSLTIPDGLPSQTGHSGKFLTTDGTDASWGSPDLSGKADVDMSNVNTSGKSLISGLPMPSNRYTDLTLGASGSTYTAPANGWFAVSKTSGGTGKYIGLLNATSDFGVETYPNAATNNAKLIIPIKKNDVLQVIYSLTGTTNYFKFIYAEGEPNV